MPYFIVISSSLLVKEINQKKKEMLDNQCLLLTNTKFTFTVLSLLTSKLAISLIY